MCGGLYKRLVVLYKPFGGNAMHFYDQSQTLILDALHFYKAECVYYTNHMRTPGEPIEGFQLIDREVMIYGVSTVRNRLCVCVNVPHGHHAFRDEFSFIRWKNVYISDVIIE